MKPVARILLIVGLVVVVATCVLFLLTTDRETRDGVSWFSLALVVLAEAGTTGFLLGRRRQASENTPVFFGKLALILLFDLAVVISVVVLDWILDVPMRSYLAVLIVIITLLTVIFGAMMILDRRSGRSSRISRDGRAALSLQADTVQSVIDRLAAGPPSPARSSLMNDLNALKENIRLSDPVGHPASAPLEAELIGKLGELKGAVNAAPAADTSMPGADGLKTLVAEAQALLSRRNTVLKDAK